MCCNNKKSEILNKIWLHFEHITLKVSCQNTIQISELLNWKISHSTASSSFEYKNNNQAVEVGALNFKSSRVKINAFICVNALDAETLSLTIFLFILAFFLAPHVVISERFILVCCPEFGRLSVGICFNKNLLHYVCVKIINPKTFSKNGQKMRINLPF